MNDKMNIKTSGFKCDKSCWQKDAIGHLANIDTKCLSSSTSGSYSFKYISIECVSKGRLNNVMQFDFASAPSRARRIVHKNDVLISTVRPNLQSHLFIQEDVKDWICSTGFSVISCRHDLLEPYFLFAYLFSNNFAAKIEELTTGSNYPSITSKDISNLEIPLPPLEVQKQIASALADIDTQISVTQKLLSKYESIKKATVNLLLKPKTGWIETQLGNVCQEIHERISCSRLTTQNYISTENLLPERNGIVEASSIPFDINVISFMPNDILISNIRPYLKKVWFAEFSGGCSSDVIVYRANNKIHPRLLFHIVSQDAFFSYAMDNAIGTKMPRGDRSLLPLFPISFPSELGEQEQIANYIDNLIACIGSTLKDMRKLEKLKQSMLQYFFG